MTTLLVVNVFSIQCATLQILILTVVLPSALLPFAGPAHQLLACFNLLPCSVFPCPDLSSSSVPASIHQSHSSIHEMPLDFTHKISILICSGDSHNLHLECLPKDSLLVKGYKSPCCKTKPLSNNSI